MSQGTPGTETDTADEDFDDLDALLTERALAPRQVKLGGRTFTVRRDLSGQEVLRYWSLTHQRLDVEALAIVVGEEDAPALGSMLDLLPHVKRKVIRTEIMTLAGLLPRDDVEDGDNGWETTEPSPS